jgi:hypothetical protein
MMTVRVTVHYQSLLDATMQTLTFDYEQSENELDAFNLDTEPGVPRGVAGIYNTAFAVPGGTSIILPQTIQRIDWEVL